MPKILIVEDEPSIADNIRIALDLEGFENLWAPTLAQAHEFLVDEAPALIILDIGLPDGSGFDFCRELRTTQNIPVIMLTARSDEIDRIVGLELGADDYVTKPFSPRELAARVKSVLRRTQNSFEVKTECSHSSKLHINSQTFAASYGDFKLKLSAHEFHLIEALAEHPGRIFSRQQLLERAWQDPNSAMERTVDAHVKSLRAKLKKTIGKDLIVTHRGFGYSLEDNE
ncbi:two-component system response regulator CreB [Lentisphaera profundi]|uniref:Two-component system response regulator CreB n=1 Tax=Lentisphaera profundi TaxID=1658616 RepID=A0ABY7VWN2_9BACT|nr:two-component system response regulator CreB [Lentisphaera profundi]WDE98661.1 two-component system response regulator CreB [Lentisphaera profundi]